MSNSDLTQTEQWRALKEHHERLSKRSIASLFDEDSARFSNFSHSLDGLLFDYSKTLTTDETLASLVSLAHSCELEQWRDKMFAGAAINNSEDRAVLHVALRGSVDNDLGINGEKVNAFVSGALDKIKNFSENIRREKQFTDIVNIGIGGSDVGPHMVYDALRPFADGPHVHFVSNVDGAHLAQVLEGLEPETTLFIIASKTFTTLETMTNARSAQAWLDGRPIEKHFAAVTENEQAAIDFGIDRAHILPLRSWIGGRYSLWSAIGISTAISCGYDHFEKLLAGAHAMDQHFKTAPLEKNIPVLMALIGVWHRNFCGYDALAILPYAQDLHKFPAYVQQLDMESNGKTVDRDGRDVNYHTSPVVFGETGTNGQHAFFQLFHQGSMVTPCDFIMVVNPQHDLDEHHEHLLANALAQSEAMMRGVDKADVPYNRFDGGRPSVGLILQSLDPYHLGMLLAAYEHKTFTQGIVWNLNSFDQWGVELGKTIAKDIYPFFKNADELSALPPSTYGVLRHILQQKNKNS